MIGKHTKNDLSKKIAIICHHSLNHGPELPAGIGHGVPVNATHHLIDLLHQEGSSAVRCFVNM